MMREEFREKHNSYLLQASPSLLKLKSESVGALVQLFCDHGLAEVECGYCTFGSHLKALHKNLLKTLKFIMMQTINHFMLLVH